METIVDGDARRWRLLRAGEIMFNRLYFGSKIRRERTAELSKCESMCHSGSVSDVYHSLEAGGGSA